jgi:hypothetical protein
MSNRIQHRTHNLVYIGVLALVPLKNTFNWPPRSYALHRLGGKTINYCATDTTVKFTLSTMFGEINIS